MQSNQVAFLQRMSDILKANYVSEYRARVLQDTKHILIADDDRNDILIFERSLKAAGVLNPLKVVRDGAEAVDYLAGEGVYADRTQYPLPDLMLLDLKMPKLDGFDVLTWWRENGQGGRFPIVVLSGSALPQDIEMSRTLGAFAYRVKPGDAEGLSKLAEEVRDHWLAVDTKAPPEKVHDTKFFYPA
jgi:CheY-like chemotaxis protein